MNQLLVNLIHSRPLRSLSRLPTAVNRPHCQSRHRRRVHWPPGGKDSKSTGQCQCLRPAHVPAQARAVLELLCYNVVPNSAAQGERPTHAPGQNRRARRARAQPEEHRRRDPARQAGGHHRPVRLRQVVAGLRHHLRRRPAPLRRVALRLRPPVPGPDGEARRRLHRGALARPSPSTRRAPAATRARPWAPSPRSTTTCACSSPASASPHCPNCGREISQQTVQQIVDAILALPDGSRIMILAPADHGPQGRAPARLRGPAQGRLRARARRRRGPRPGRGDRAGQEQEAHHRGGGRPPGRAPAGRGRPTRRPRRASPTRWRRRSSWATASCWSRVVDGEELLFSEHFACVHCGISLRRDRAAHLLASTAPRRLPGLHRPGHEAGDRPGPGHPQQGPDPGRGRHPAVDAHRAPPTTATTRSCSRPWPQHYGFSHGRAGAASCTPEQLEADPLRQRAARRSQCATRTSYGHMREYETTFEGVIPNLERRYQRDRVGLHPHARSSATWPTRPCPACQGKRLKPESLAVTVGGQ